jgi:ankyrin repeat protein
VPSAALLALYEGDAEKARELLGADAELDVFDAAAFGRLDRLRELLAQDPALTGAFSDDGFTPLHLAIYGDQEPSARALIDAGADVNVRSTGAIAKVPPLGTAAFVGSVPLARLLLDSGADANGENADGDTALDSAIFNADAEMIAELEARGARRKRD